MCEGIKFANKTGRQAAKKYKTDMTRKKKVTCVLNDIGSLPFVRFCVILKFRRKKKHLAFVPFGMCIFFVQL